MTHVAPLAVKPAALVSTGTDCVASLAHTSCQASAAPWRREEQHLRSGISLLVVIVLAAAFGFGVALVALGGHTSPGVDLDPCSTQRCLIG